MDNEPEPTKDPEPEPAQSDQVYEPVSLFISEGVLVSFESMEWSPAHTTTTVRFHIHKECLPLPPRLTMAFSSLGLPPLVPFSPSAPLSVAQPDFLASDYSSSLLPFSSTRLFLPSDSTIVLTPTGSATGLLSPRLHLRLCLGPPGTNPEPTPKPNLNPELLWINQFLSYDECVGQGTQIYIPTDDPPPYSLTDPCRAHYHRETEDLPAGASWVSASSSSQYPTRLQDFRHQPIASISLSALPFEEAPPYEAVVSEQNQPLPLMPLDLLKHTTADSSPQDSVSHRIL
ncbi:hypothetical protein PO909_023775 [Leuciscus waleckii]